MTKKNLVITLLILALVFLWGRLRDSKARLKDEQARADANADKAHKYDQTAEDTARITQQYGEHRTPLSAVDYAVICAENDLIPIDWTDQGDKR